MAAEVSAPISLQSGSVTPPVAPPVALPLSTHQRHRGELAEPPADLQVTMITVYLIDDNVSEKKSDGSELHAGSLIMDL